MLVLDIITLLQCIQHSSTIMLPNKVERVENTKIPDPKHIVILDHLKDPNLLKWYFENLNCSDYNIADASQVLAEWLHAKKLAEYCHLSWAAVKSGNLDVYKLIHRKYRIRDCDVCGVIEHNYLHVLKWLITVVDFDINSVIYDESNVDTIIWLTSNKRFNNVIDELGFYGDMRLVKHLCNISTETEVVLHHTINNNQLEVIKYVASRFSIICDTFSVQWAALHGHDELVRWIEESGYGKVSTLAIGIMYTHKLENKISDMKIKYPHIFTKQNMWLAKLEVKYNP